MSKQQAVTKDQSGRERKRLAEEGRIGEKVGFKPRMENTMRQVDSRATIRA